MPENKKDDLDNYASELAAKVETRQKSGQSLESGFLPKILETLKRTMDLPGVVSNPALLPLRTLLPDDSRKTARELGRAIVDIGPNSPGDAETSATRKRLGKAALGTIAEAASLYSGGGVAKKGALAFLDKYPKIQRTLEGVGSAMGNKGVKGVLAGAAGVRNYNADPDDYSDIGSSLGSLGISGLLSNLPGLQKMLAVNPTDSSRATKLKSLTPLLESVGANTVGQMVDGREGWDKTQTTVAAVGSIPGVVLQKMARTALVNAANTPTATARAVEDALGPEGPSLNRPNTFAGLRDKNPANLPTERQTNEATKLLQQKSDALIGSNSDQLFERLPNNGPYVRNARAFDPNKAQSMVAAAVELRLKTEFDKGIKDNGIQVAPDSPEYKQAYDNFKKMAKPAMYKVEGSKILDSTIGEYNEKIATHNKKWNDFVSQYADPRIGLTETNNQGGRTGISKELSDKLTKQTFTKKYVKLGDDGKIYTKTQEEFDKLKPENRGVWRGVDEVVDPPKIDQNELDTIVKNAKESQAGVKNVEKRFNEYLQESPEFQKGLSQVLDKVPAWNTSLRRSVGQVAREVASSESMAKSLFDPKKFDAIYAVMDAKDNPQMRSVIKQQISKGMSEMTGEWRDILQQEGSGKKVVTAPLDKFVTSIGGDPDRISKFNELYENPKAYENMVNLLKAHKKSLEVISAQKFDPKIRSLVFPTMFMLYGGQKLGVVPSGMAEPLGFAAAGAAGAALHRRNSGLAVMENMLQDPSGMQAKLLAKYWEDPIKNARIGHALGRIFAQLGDRPEEVK